jgi:hypothetical protein
MNASRQSIILLIAIAAAACSQKGDESSAAVTPATNSRPTTASVPATPAIVTAESDVPSAPPPVPEAPATLTDFNLAAAHAGGSIEELTGSYGPGLLGHRLIDGLPDQTWFAPAEWQANMMYSKIYFAKYPQDVVISFYERRPALVGAIAVLPPDKPTVPVEDASTAPAAVEVWTSMDMAHEHFTKVATATLESRPGEQTITFPATEARFVRIRLLSGASERVVEMAEVRVLESTREGYEPLFNRVPDAKLWKGSPREAAQRGLEWLQQSAVDWSTWQKCFGCHVQAQALMGQAVALKNGYRVSMPAIEVLTDFMRQQQKPTGTLGTNHEWTSAVFGAMGFAYAAEANGRTSDPELFKTVDYLLGIQKKKE